MKHFEWLFIIWAVIAIVLAVFVSTVFEAAFPIFTIIWIGISLFAVLRTKNAGSVGFIKVRFNELIKATAINLGLTCLIFLLFEPWSHTYRTLIQLSTGSSNQDVTFVWLARYGGVKAYAGMLLFSGFVTLFGEELFFRGLLFQFFKKRINAKWAVFLQAIFFIIPNILAALFMPLLQGLIYTVAYAGAAIGLAGGLSARRTGSIWPGLISATISNLVLVMLLY